MISGRQEIFEPEDLRLLGSVFDQTWASVAAEPFATRLGDGARHELANILLGLGQLRQVGPEQLGATAARLFRRRSERMVCA
jgi:hypothetical protein